jgi:hypothetical protein
VQGIKYYAVPAMAVSVSKNLHPPLIPVVKQLGDVSKNIPVQNPPKWAVMRRLTRMFNL